MYFSPRSILLLLRGAEEEKGTTASLEVLLHFCYDKSRGGPQPRRRWIAWKSEEREEREPSRLLPGDHPWKKVILGRD